MRLARNMKSFIGEFKNRVVNTLEIGVFKGDGSRWIIDNICNHPESRHLGIDPNVDVSIPKMTFIKGFSQDVLYNNKYDKQSFDFIFIDGHHTVISVMRDFVFTWPLLKINGIMVFDDYGMRFRDGVRVAVDAILHGLGKQRWRRTKYDLLFKNYQVGIRKLYE